MSDQADRNARDKPQGEKVILHSPAHTQGGLLPHPDSGATGTAVDHSETIELVRRGTWLVWCSGYDYGFSEEHWMRRINAPDWLEFTGEVDQEAAAFFAREAEIRNARRGNEL